MNSIQIVAATAAIGLLANAAASAHAAPEREARNLAGFETIRIEGGVDLTVEIGDRFSVEIEADADDLADVRTEVRGDALAISTKRRGRNVEDVEVRIIMPRFSGLDVSGAVDATISGVQSDAVAIEISGAGDVEIDGACGALTLDLSGAADIDAEGLQCARADVEVSGVGDVRIYASEAADVDISGVGEVEVSGNPSQVRESSGWLSSVSVR